MENISQWVGIDVSKATLDVYIRPMGKAFFLLLILKQK
jgi:transposase